MGANWFATYSAGGDVEVAFHGAVEDAASEHGNHGYSGTIAEKHGYVIITRSAVSRDEAERLADDLCVRDDPRVVDKWGPAGAIPITGSPHRTTRAIPTAGCSAAGPAAKCPADHSRHPT